MLSSRLPPSPETADSGIAHATAIATIVRINGGRLVDRLLTQIERVIALNQLTQVTPEVVDAARRQSSSATNRRRNMAT